MAGMIFNVFKSYLKSWALILVVLGFLAPKIAAADFKINVMGPRGVGDLRNAHKYPETWDKFQQELYRAKRLGVDAISIDIWWGAVEVADGVYDWSYYDKVFEAIRKADLKLIPIFSFHQLGTNVGDEGFQALPPHIFQKYIGEPGVENATSLLYKSEQGNYNFEVISPWGTPYVLDDYQNFMRAFQMHYSHLAPMMEELNVSLGPAGELRTPSYNSHDSGSDYPTRGTLQAYSDLAIASFRSYVLSKYTRIERLNSAWGTDLKNFSEVGPPQGNLDKFFEENMHFSLYGQDFFDWYNHSLTKHGKTLLLATADIFNDANSRFRGIPIGAKIPGVHWRMTHDRIAELNAGLIRTSYQDWRNEESGHGYLHTLKMFREVALSETKPNIVVHFTALEMNDGENGPQVGSQAKSLVVWMHTLARRLGLNIKGENALAQLLQYDYAWENIRDALHQGYSGITLLRLEDILSSEPSTRGLKRLITHRKIEWCKDLLTLKHPPEVKRPVR